jgi:hypothetical protein
MGNHPQRRCAGITQSFGAIDGVIGVLVHIERKDRCATGHL